MALEGCSYVFTLKILKKAGNKLQLNMAQLDKWQILLDGVADDRCGAALVDMEDVLEDRGREQGVAVEGDVKQKPAAGAAQDRSPIVSIAQSLQTSHWDHFKACSMLGAAVSDLWGEPSMRWKGISKMPLQQQLLRPESLESPAWQGPKAQDQAPRKALHLVSSAQNAKVSSHVGQGLRLMICSIASHGEPRP